MTQKFSLQRVLDLKEQVEDLLQIELAAIEGRRLELQHRVDELRRKRDRVSEHQRSVPSQPIDTAQLAAASDYLEVLDGHIESGNETIHEVRVELDGKRAELEVAYQEKELLKRLKQRRLAAEIKTEARKDARSMEEVATSQFLRRAPDKADQPTSRSEKP